MILKNLLGIFVFCLLMLFNIYSTTAQQVVYTYSFNGRQTLTDNSFGWSIKNNTNPPTANEDQGWTLEGADEGWVGPPFDASSLDNFADGFIKVFGAFAGTERTTGVYNYASVGFSENDYDNATISKWLISRVFYGMKNGDQIKFRTKQRWISEFQTIGTGAAGDLQSLDCNRPNRMEVRLSIGDSTDLIPPNVGNTATSVGTFTTVLLTINPDLTIEGYPNDWTEYTATISGIPEGKTASGRIAFRYAFPEGGYAKCKDSKPLPEPANQTLDFTLDLLGSMEDGPDELGSALLAINVGRKLINIAINDQQGKNGTTIGLDDFRYIRNSRTYVTESYDGSVWYDGRQPATRPLFSYRGSPDCFTEGRRSDGRFYFVNNSETPITIHVAPSKDEFAMLIDGDSNKQVVTVPAGATQFIYLGLKPNLRLSGVANRNLVIRENSSTGPILHTIRLAYEILTPPPPIPVCSTFPKPITLSDSGKVTLVNPADFDLGSATSYGCAGPLDFGFAKSLNYGSPLKQLEYTCADAGMNTAYLIVTNTKTGATATCPIQVEVKRPMSANSVANQVQTYYIDYQGKMPIDSLVPPKAAGPCATSATALRIMKVGDRSVDYLSSPGLPVGQYYITWLMSFSSGTPLTREVTTELNVLDTIKPKAFCKDTTKIGFTYVTILGIPGPPRIKLRDDINPFRDIDNGSYDNSGRVGGGYLGGSGVAKYTIYSPWYTGAVQYFADSFEIQCSNIGLSFPVTLKVTDASGNFSTCQSYVKIVNPSEPECKNTTIAINPTTGIKNITTSDVLANGVSGVCGMQNVALSRSSFTCADINKTIPVTVGYTDPDGVVRGCVANVTVKSYSIPEGTCKDSVKAYLTSFSDYQDLLDPLVLSACNSQQPWSLWVGNIYFPSLTGSKAWNFQPGITEVTRRAIVSSDTFTCRTIYAVYDTLPPVITTTVSNSFQTIPTLPNYCKQLTEVPNPFQQGTYKEWSYEFTGATTKKVLIKNSDEYGRYVNDVRIVRNEGWPSYWLNQWDSINPGVTTVTIKAKDNAANETTVSYTITLNELSPNVPSVGYFGAQMPTVRGNFCGTTYNHYIESPMSVPCNQTGYMWYFQVRDGYMGNILYEQDSIPQNAGAFIPLKIGPYLNQTYYNTIHFGYHDKTYGTKQYSSNSDIRVVDTISPIIVPNNVFIQNTNDSTFNYAYAIPSPIQYQGSCSGARWGYKITGATTLSSTPNGSITYTSNQLAEFGFTDYSQWYPSIPADSSPVVMLNNGVNTIEYVILEESGVSSTWTNAPYKYMVSIQDVSEPKMTCAGNDTLYRAAGPCNVSVTNPGAQVNGFTGPFAKSRFRLFGGNSRVVLNKKTAPDSITFISTNTGSTINKNAYIAFIFNYSGTVTFNWTYQSSAPGFFRPFALTDTLNRFKVSPPLLSGFSETNTGVQSGTFTQVVQAGDILKIGVYEGGGVSGYLKISNFSAPYATPSPTITQPTYPDNAAYYFKSNLDTVYPIGTSQITYALTNINNGKTVYCQKSIVVIDSFARSLNCQNQTLYLGPYGSVILKPSAVLPTSCFPISSTKLNKDTFTGSDIGTQVVGVTSIGTMNDTLTCNFNVTVLDTTRPAQRMWQITLPLSPSGTAILTDSMVKNFFYDNHKVVSVTKAKTNFTVDDVGLQNVLLSASDSVGNTNTISAQILITPGFAPFTQSNSTINTCSRDSITLKFETEPGYTLSYQWQQKEKTDSIKHWNYYTCTGSTSILDGTSLHQFFRFRNETYVAFRSADYNHIQFMRLDTFSNHWRPALSSISVSFVNQFQVYVNTQAHPSNQELRVAFLDPSTNKFAVQLYRQDTTWYTYKEAGGDCNIGSQICGLDYFSYQADGPGVFAMASSQNSSITKLFGNNGNFFPVRNSTVNTLFPNYEMYCVYQDSSTGSEYPTSFKYQTGDSVTGTFGNKYPIIRFDLSSWNTQIDHIANGRIIVAIRNNSANQNRFFALTRGSNGVVTGRDSLSTDPSNGSALFDIESFNNSDYIAYKSANGKICVKKYTGSNTWSTVGTLDFSDEQITKLDITTVNNQLYLAYLEVTGRVVLKQLNDNNWIDMASPNNNLTFTVAGSSDPVSIVNINNQPALYYNDSRGGYRLLKLDQWKTIAGATAQTYKPNLTTAGITEYRCMASSSSISTPSEVKRVQVTTTPTIRMGSAQQNVVYNGTAQLQVISTGANTDWKYNFNEGSGFLATGNTLTLQNLEEDQKVYAYSFNENCYSDTVSAKIYVFDSSMSIYHVIVKDSICSDDFVQASLDTSLLGYKYSLFKRDTSGTFIDQNQYLVKTQEWQNVEYYLTPSQTEEYQIKVEKVSNDALQLQTGDIYYNHINFGDSTLPITNELTIETWVIGISTNPFYLLGLKAHNKGFWDPDSTKNWSWNGNTFDVYNGNQKRSLNFPSLPASNTWTHVATTAGPNGMRIYYDGVLVASDTTSSTVDFNQIKSDLLLGIKESGANTYYAFGLDEFRIWNTVRTDSEIAGYKDVCLTGNESGLVLYNSFSDYNASSKKFVSTKGSDGNFVIYNSGDVLTTTNRNSTCIANQPPAQFIPPFTVNVVSNQPTIVSHTEYIQLPDSACNGQMVTIHANSNMGGVTWYNAFTGGDVVGVGSNLTIFVDSSMILYPAADNSVCQRKETFIEAVEKPTFYGYEYDPFCAGSNVGYFYVDYRGDGYRIFEDSIGGYPLDIDSIRNDVMINQADTFWIDVYNLTSTGGGGGGEEEPQPDEYVQYGTVGCVTPARYPIIFNPTPKPTVIATYDSTRYGPGTVTLKAIPGANQFVQWFDINGSFADGWDTVFTTPYLTTTTQYIVKALDNNWSCDRSEGDTVTAFIIPYPTRSDTVIACESYTWENGMTYTLSDTNIFYFKPNATGGDSLIQLHLTIIPFENTQLSVNKTSMCLNDSATITVFAAQNNYEYLLMNATTQAIVQGPITGNGSNIVFNTGPLTQHVSYKVIATDTASVNNQTLGCTKQIGETIHLRVGSLFSSSELSTCGSYVWRGQLITQTGIYFDTLASTQGCDSVLELRATIFPIGERIDSVSTCGSYVWYGITYNASTSTPTRFLGLTEYGCDSVVRLHLTINNNSAVDSRLAWDSLTWINGITYTANNNTAQYTLTNSKGCDSVVTLNLTILNSADRTVLNPQAICAGGSYTFNGNVYTAAGTYRDTLYAGTGNDSIFVTQLTVNSKPVTSAITGQINPVLGSTETYSVMNTAGSTYNWIITNGTQVSGGNTNIISVLWSNTIVAAAVKVVETSIYGCTGDSVTQNVALPVSLLNFTATKKTKAVELRWSTSSEQNNKGFEVERSLDATTFEKLGFVKGNGTTNQTSYYTYNDVTYYRAGANGNTAPAVAYYRLKQYDFNGTFEYSPVVAVNNQTTAQQAVVMNASPNPFQTGFELNINSGKETEAAVEVFDAFGKRVASKTIHLVPGETFFSFEQAGEWKAGMYFIVLWVDGERQTLRIVRE